MERDERPVCDAQLLQSPIALPPPLLGQATHETCRGPNQLMLMQQLGLARHAEITPPLPDP